MVTCARLADSWDVAKTSLARIRRAGSGEGSLSPQLPLFFASVFPISAHFYLEAWNRLLLREITRVFTCNASVELNTHTD